MVNDDIYAKPIVDNKFWIIEHNGLKIATLHKKENDQFILSNSDGEIFFNNRDDLTSQFGTNFFHSYQKTTISSVESNECYGYPTSCKPYNSVYDIRRKLPLFTKSNNSKSLYCAGYYIIKFDKGWVKSFCPKTITIERYPSKGPFKTEIEMRLILSNAKSD